MSKDIPMLRSYRENTMDNLSQLLAKINNICEELEGGISPDRNDISDFDISKVLECI